MIDDLFAELTLEAVDRMIAENATGQSDHALARVAARLTPPTERETSQFDPELAFRLESAYFRLGVDDLVELSSGVHEWVLEHMAATIREWTPEMLDTIATLYFLYPESTLRSAAVGLLLQVEHQPRGRELSREEPLTASIARSIADDDGIDSASRSRALLELGEFLIDYVDVFPAEAARSLAAVVSASPDDRLSAYFLLWADRLGGDAGELVRRASEGPERGGYRG